MGFDHNNNNNNCNDHHLNLGLGFAAVKKAAITNSTITNTTNNLEPSLTLALSNSLDHNLINISNNNNRSSIIDMKNNMIADHVAYGRQASPPHSAVSSFSGGGGRVVKRERDVASSEEVEAEHEKGSNNSRGVSDEDEDGSNARKKLRLTKEQSALLEESFKQHSTLNPKQKQALARQLNLRARQVEVWFQNRRARTKLKQTEVDCEFLKKCCETLTDENRRLQKELQELKALKLAQPLYMHMPAATLSMCPSCERVGSAAAGSAGDLAGAGPGAGPKMSQFSMAHLHPKQHFYSPFTNPSAAC